MKPHPKIRKTVKWGGAAVTVLLVVVWVGSMFIACQRAGPNGWVAAGAGRVGVGWYWQVPSNGVIDPPWFVLTSPRIMWSIEAQAGTGRLVLPLWLPAALVFTICAYRYDNHATRRAELNLCPKCNYDRSGLVVRVVCPECGSGGSPA